MRPAVLGVIASRARQGLGYVAGSSTTFVIATSQNVSIPAAAQTGDLLLAWVMHRDNLTPPSGWTLVRNETCANSTLTRHDLSLYSRTALSGDPGASTTWTQATSQRLAVHIQAYRGTASPTVASHDGSAASNILTAAAVPYASITANAGQLVVHGASQVLSASTTINTTVTASAGALTTPASDLNLRMFVAYRIAPATGAQTGQFNTNVTDGTSNGQAGISVVIA
jgi:hypothetical protein